MDLERTIVGFIVWAACIVLVLTFVGVPLLITFLNEVIR